MHAQIEVHKKGNTLKIGIKLKAAISNTEAMQ